MSQTPAPAPAGAREPAAATSVAVVGVGLMGAQIGVEYALGGCTVALIARDQERARERVERALELVLRHGLADELGVERARSSMSCSDQGPFELIVESLPEDLALKGEVLAPLAAGHPEAIIATNTSSISIGALGRAAGVAERILGTHYWNPPLLMPLVEVLAGEDTPRSLRDRVVALLRSIGKRPVVLEAEADGLLWNRLQLAVLRECLWLVEHGIATPETIDEVMRDGLARRWRLTGPFETVGLGGAQTFDAIAENLFPVLAEAKSGSGFAPHVPTDPTRLAALRERRDAALAAELRQERGGR
ncbi:MAG TPA: 3-hydroxyacyl-CoA dehydrogenase family protein [Solirubrobacteraceae bacterium]|jgi:3-hydroxybutyryl-CoA dehydrogenase|nr:3-hydroxyacyl-CoA dehydrogenase family protein [Solirubrobacteraceae bacterium]